MATVTLVIPARLASTRLPQKPLADIKGKPMIQHVYERALKVSGKDRVVVATDDELIKSAVKKFGGEALLTSVDLQSGTDRVGAVADLIPGHDDDIFVNVQGDEPMVAPSNIEASIDMVRNKGFDIGTCASRLTDVEALQNMNVVKALVAYDGRAIYFSRYPIPYSRVMPTPNEDFVCWQHQGIYAYRRSTLKKFCGLARTRLEVLESLEQLRALHNGLSIGVAIVTAPSIGVDTPEDLELVRKLI